ncbi:MAG: hypothetical protein RL375_626 [Pseudomonadota bacterium]|jgi:hypothetical protein
MKQIKPGEYKKAVCRECGNSALWRSNLITSLYACEKHKMVVVEAERDRREVGGDHLSEADLMTWAR